MKISVLIKDPGKAPRHVNIENSLANLQRTVGGNIETLILCTDCVIICNEEGRLMGLPHCCRICGVDFVGTVVIAGVAGDKFTDLPGEWKTWKQVFRMLWEEEKMKILKHGKVTQRKFVCPMCGCVFTAAFKDTTPGGWLRCPEDECGYNILWCSGGDCEEPKRDERANIPPESRWGEGVSD